MRDGATAGYKYFAFNGLRAISVRVRGAGNGQMEVRTRPDAAPIAAFSLRPTGDWQDFAGRINTEVTGEQALYFTYTGEGYVDFTAFTLE